MINRTKKGFSLVEVLILFTVLAVIMASAMPIISRKTRPVPRKVSHGVYVCWSEYGDDGQNRTYEQLFTGTRFVREDEVANGKCTFRVPQAAMYKVDLYSAGAGGNKIAQVQTTYNDFRSIVYSLSHGGYINKQYENSQFDDEGATPSNDADPIYKFTDQDIANAFEGDKIIRSAYTQNAGIAGSATMQIIRPQDSVCTAYEHVMNMHGGAVAVAQSKEDEIKNRLKALYDKYVSDKNEYEIYNTFAKNYFDTYKQNRTDNIWHNMYALLQNELNTSNTSNTYQNIINIKSETYTKDISQKPYASDFVSRFDDAHDAFKDDVEGTISGKYTEAYNKVQQLKTGAESAASGQAQSATQNIIDELVNVINQKITYVDTTNPKRRFAQNDPISTTDYGKIRATIISYANSNIDKFKQDQEKAATKWANYQANKVAQSKADSSAADKANDQAQAQARANYKNNTANQNAALAWAKNKVSSNKSTYIPNWETMTESELEQAINQKAEEIKDDYFKQPNIQQAMDAGIGGIPAAQTGKKRKPPTNPGTWWNIYSTTYDSVYNQVYNSTYNTEYDSYFKANYTNKEVSQYNSYCKTGLNTYYGNSNTTQYKNAYNEIIKMTELEGVTAQPAVGQGDNAYKKYIEKWYYIYYDNGRNIPEHFRRFITYNPDAAERAGVINTIYNNSDIIPSAYLNDNAIWEYNKHKNDHTQTFNALKQVVIDQYTDAINVRDFTNKFLNTTANDMQTVVLTDKKTKINYNNNKQGTDKREVTKTLPKFIQDAIEESYDLFLQAANGNENSGTRLFVRDDGLYFLTSTNFDGVSLDSSGKISKVTEEKAPNDASIVYNYFASSVGLYDKEYKAQNAAWEAKKTEYNTNYQDMEQNGQLTDKLRTRAIYGDVYHSFDELNPDSRKSVNGEDMGALTILKNYSNTYTQLKTFCRVNNIDQFLKTYDSKITEIEDDLFQEEIRDKLPVADVEGARNRAAAVNPNSTVDVAGLKELMSEAHKELRRKKAIEVFLGTRAIGQGAFANATYGDMLQSFWNDPITANVDARSRVEYDNESNAGSWGGGYGGFGGWLRIQYPLMYVEHFTHGGEEINQGYYDENGQPNVKDLDTYIQLIRSTQSPEGRYLVMCKTMGPDGYNSFSVNNGNVAAAKEASDRVCKPFNYTDSSNAFWQDKKYKDAYAKTPEADGGRGGISRDVEEADYFNQTHRFGPQGNEDKLEYRTRRFEGSVKSDNRQRRSVHTYPGANMSEYEYPFVAWHIPIHDENNPYKIVGFRNISLVQGTDKLAKGGRRVDMYMEERDGNTSRLSYNENSIVRSFVSNLPNTLSEIALKLYNYETTDAVKNAEDEILGVVYSPTKKDYAYKVYNNYIHDYANPKGRPNSLQTAEGGTDDGQQGLSTQFGLATTVDDSVKINNGIQRDYQIKVDSLQARSLEEAQGLLNGLTGDNRQIAEQDPQLKIMSSMWKKKYVTGKSGKPGKMLSITTSNLGKICSIDVPQGGLPYDITEEDDISYDVNGSYQQQFLQSAKNHLKELEAGLDIDMKCGNTLADIDGNKDISFHKHLQGGSYQTDLDNIAHSQTEFKWNNTYDVNNNENNGEESKSFFDRMKEFVITGEQYEGSDGGKNKQPVWNPTSIWAKVFRRLNSAEGLGGKKFVPKDKGIGKGGDGTTLHDRCTLKKGFYQKMKQYERRYFKVCNVGDSGCHSPVLSHNHQHQLTNESYIGLTDKEFVKMDPETPVNQNFTGRVTIGGLDEDVDCYFDNDNAAVESSHTVDLTSQHPYVKDAQAYILETGRGNGGAVVITW